ncbi:MAG TPA: hypothetical protein VHG91_13305 [Longimicrobium sp.]|nr:hypothetical protein [Longimicrobium sp.]
MRSFRKVAGLGAIVLAASLGGCAPVFEGMSPSLNVYGQCSQIQRQSRSAMTFRQVQRVSAVQSRFMLGFSQRSTESWKRAAAGGC